MQAEDGMTCLHLAAQAGQSKVVEYLVRTLRMDVNVKVNTLSFAMLSSE